VLERELDVLDVLEVLLELGRQAIKLAVDLGELAALHPGNRFRRTCPRDDVLTLRIGEHVTVEDVLSSPAVARERNAGAAVVAHVAVDHGHDVDRSTETIRNAVHLAIVVRTTRVPALEDGFDGAP